MAKVRVNSENIKLGMCYPEPLFFDDGKNMFLAKGKPVKPYHLRAISSWSIPYLLIEGTDEALKEFSAGAASGTPAGKKNSAPKKSEEKNAGAKKSDAEAADLEELEEVDDLETLG